MEKGRSLTVLTHSFIFALRYEILRWVADLADDDSKNILSQEWGMQDCCLHRKCWRVGRSLFYVGGTSIRPDVKSSKRGLPTVTTTMAKLAFLNSCTSTQ